MTRSSGSSKAADSPTWTWSSTTSTSGSKPRRDRRQITVDAANAIKEHGVGVKCATITPDEDAGPRIRPESMYPRTGRSATSSAAIFPRADRDLNVPRLVPGWTKPIIISRHAFGDQYGRPTRGSHGDGTLR
jgi:isocitrate dehydrogenase